MSNFKTYHLYKVVAVFAIIIYTISCSTKTKDSKIYYIINEHKMADKTSGKVIPNEGYYADFNFILLDSSTYFFRYRPPFHFCGTGFDFSKPPVLNLVPDSLIKIETQDIRPFLLNLLKDSVPYLPPLFKHRRSVAAISSPTDTIRNISFKIISEFLDSNNFIIGNIRLLTEEETHVLTAKVGNKIYNPDSIKWKFGFDNGCVPRRLKSR